MRPAARPRQRGFTLIELLVAMLIGFIVVLAAVAALSVSRIGFTTVDAASQLRDNARFAADIIERITVQTGFRDTYFAALPPATRTANITGYNNSKVDVSGTSPAPAAWSGGQAGSGSDTLILSYQAARLYPLPNPDGTPNTQTDQSMIDCSGNAPAAVPDLGATTTPAPSDTVMTSIFSVDLDVSGEPSLMCTYIEPTTGAWTTVPLVRGVEQFQVLYGVDGVNPGVAPTATTKPLTPMSYLRADQMIVPGDTIGTNANWQRVRALRIGLVLRSAINSTQGPTTPAPTYYAFGVTPSSASTTAGVGSAFSSTDDAGTIFTPNPPDTRLRQVSTFTIHLRNDQTS